jgi:hypothetical protein
VQATHLFVATAQTGVAPEQSELALQGTQRPSIKHTGAAGVRARQSASWEHPVHSFRALSQMGRAAAVQSVSAAQATHLAVVGWQAGVAPEQSAGPLHSTQRPLAQTVVLALFALHWASLAQGTQSLRAGSQMGRSALLHSADDAQAPPASTPAVPSRAPSVPLPAIASARSPPPRSAPPSRIGASVAAPPPGLASVENAGLGVILVQARKQMAVARAESSAGREPWLMVRVRIRRWGRRACRR